MKTKKEWDRENEECWAKIHEKDRQMKKEYEDRWYGPAKRSVSKEEISARAANMPGRGPGISNENWWRPPGAYAYYNDKHQVEPDSGLMNNKGQWIGETHDSLRIKMERE